MYCKKCGALLAQSATFCMACGTKNENIEIKDLTSPVAAYDAGKQKNRNKWTLNTVIFGAFSIFAALLWIMGIWMASSKKIALCQDWETGEAKISFELSGRLTQKTIYRSDSTTLEMIFTSSWSIDKNNKMKEYVKKCTLTAGENSEDLDIDEEYQHTYGKAAVDGMDGYWYIKGQRLYFSGRVYYVENPILWFIRRFLLLTVSVILLVVFVILFIISWKKSDSSEDLVVGNENQLY